MSQKLLGLLKKIVPYLLGGMMLAGAAAHVAVPELYLPMIPDFFPAKLANGAAALFELVIGLALLIPKYRTWGGLAFMVLMIAFLPLHIWDLFREDPVVGSQAAAVVRLVMQGVLIYAGLWIYRD